MEEKKYYIQRKSDENQRSFNQKLNDMVAIRYITIFGNKNGNVTNIKACSVSIQKFLNKTQTLKIAPQSLQMQDNLIYLLNHWNEYRDLHILEVIRNFVVTVADIPINSEDSTSVFKKWVDYYQSDKNRDYYAFDNLLQDLKNKTVDDEKAIGEFNKFKAIVLQKSGLSKIIDRRYGR